MSEYLTPEEQKDRLAMCREMLACWIFWQVRGNLSPEDAGTEILRVLDEAEKLGPTKAGEPEPDLSRGRAYVEEILLILRRNAKGRNPVRIPLKVQKL